MDDPPDGNRELLFGAPSSSSLSHPSIGDGEEEEEIAIGRLEELLGLDDGIEILPRGRALDITNEEAETGDELERMASFLQEGKVRDAVSKGVDLREYTHQIEVDLTIAEEESINAYLAEGSAFASLYQQINGCDEILERMENLLSGFQSDLGNISEEIKSLQDQSSTMSVQLKNRNEIEKKLSSFINDVVLPKKLVNGITKNEVNQSYLEYLHVLDKKLLFNEGALRTYGDVKACQDLDTVLIQLKHRAVSKARVFLLQQINSLKKPKTNVQILQQNTLLKYSYLNGFLEHHSPDIAAEVRTSYTQTMARIYSSYFRNYINSLTKLVEGGVRKDELIGTPESRGSGVMGFFRSKKTATRANVFSLGMRARLLDDLHAPSIVPHAHHASKNIGATPTSPARSGTGTGGTLSYPEVFRSYLHLLLDTITSEYRFHTEFFGGMVDVFSGVFESTLGIVEGSLTTYLHDCHDTIGVLLMLHIVLRNQLMMEKARGIVVPSLSKWFEGLSSHLLTRTRVLLHANATSVNSTPEALSLLHVRDTRPHYTTRRYAEFTAGVRTLQAGLDVDEVVDSMLEALRERVEALLNALANHLKRDNPQQTVIFLINNYDMILSVLKERGISSAETIRFNSLLDERITVFVGTVLRRHYNDMLVFVNNTQKAIEAGEELSVDPSKVELLVHQFKDTWKTVITEINDEFRTLFFNFNTGTEILKVVLSRLAELYQEFSSIVKQHYRSLAKDLVPLPTLTHFLKRSKLLT